MNNAQEAPSAPQTSHSTGDMIMFWGCFIALITTAFAFFSRMYLCDVRFESDFGLEKVAIGALKGAGVWPFAISIILFSLVIDRIGYRVAMIFSFVCYAIYLVLACMAYGAIQGVSGEELAAAQDRGHNLLYLGSIILALGNGTVEAFINPIVATMFSKEKTKWLNILHAGWPGGLVVAGIITIAMADTAKTGDWRLVLGTIAIPAVIYFIMLFNAKFPVSEREQAGVSYREMLAEFGAFGAFVGFGLIFMQLGEVFGWPLSVSGVLAAIVAVAFGAYTQSFGRGILAFLIVIMMPLATTEIGTDGWISGLMEKPMEAAGYNPGWVLVYTSAIMMVLRFFAGPIVHKLSPIGLLILSSILAIAGLLALSRTGSSGIAVIFVAATLYGIGKTFFWPTMLGVTAEQCPKGGALTLNAISGIGMIAVGVLGFPLIGALQEKTASAELAVTSPATAEEVLVEKSYMGFDYEAIDPDKKKEITGEEDIAALAAADKAGQFDALAKMAVFPAFMLVCYLILGAYFKSKGGYQAEVLTGHAAKDEEFTGGVEGPADK
ncbi:Major Facilitator Superfamily protein [Thalassoglobus neptunius]|uniref:Major Facilitator Superfamily protein n=1 Tax=Thalassoglobus neptunius TaxID=1938619 RepID=A0A5C5X495_9PLAN|nr:MFS transporter [Thalassoglobus neptunius]TWT57053.1 Major Facilitator Superfamily protein [Thalassoglobus neptunius]